MELPIFSIGDNVLFTSGKVFSTEGGRNAWIDAPAGLITIRGAKVMDNEWHYYNAEDPNTLYPESAVTA